MLSLKWRPEGSAVTLRRAAFLPARSSPADLLKGMGGRPRSAVTAADVRWPRRVAQPGAWGCDVAPT